MGISIEQFKSESPIDIYLFSVIMNKMSSKQNVNDMSNNERCQQKQSWPRIRKWIYKNIVANFHWLVLFALAIILFFTWDCEFSHIKDSLMNVCVGIILAVAFFLCGYYVDITIKKGVNGFWGILTQIGQDLSKLLSWLFSVNGLFVLLVGAVISGVVFIVLHRSESTNDVGIQGLTITLTLTLAALIPILISRIVAKNQLNEIIEQKLDKELLRYKASLTNIRRDKGHASRMSASLLEQMADFSSSTAADREKNAAWSIGWAADAIIQYVLIRDEYSNALIRSAECISIIRRVANKHLHVSSGPETPSPSEIQTRIKPRDLKSILTMHSLLVHYGLVGILNNRVLNYLYQEDENSRSNPVDSFSLENLLTNVEVLFYSKYKEQNEKEINFSSFCSITGMPADFNIELNKLAVVIVEKINQKIDQ